MLTVDFAHTVSSAVCNSHKGAGNHWLHVKVPPMYSLRLHTIRYLQAEATMEVKICKLKSVQILKPKIYLENNTCIIVMSLGQREGRGNRQTILLVILSVIPVIQLKIET